MENEDNTSPFLLVWGLGDVEVYRPKRAKSCDNCGQKKECRYPVRPYRGGLPCKSWSGVQLSPTIKKLEAMIREELR